MFCFVFFFLDPTPAGLAVNNDAFLLNLSEVLVIYRTYTLVTETTEQENDVNDSELFDRHFLHLSAFP